MSTTRDGELKPGSILAGKYRVERVLGEGGMGIVLAAFHIHLDEHVAIKTLLPEMLEHKEAVARFLREARAAVKIKSEHVARVSDVGTLDNGAPYMVMEFLEGEDLSERVAKHGPLPVEQAVEFILQACEALAEAHAAGIVHRDLKPANLFCVRRSDGLLSIKVLDFGISKMAATGTDMGMTKTTAVMGSPYYMSPEQMLSSKNADAQSDIWSLGAVLFELLVARVPFTADTLPELVLKVSNHPAPRVGTLRPEVPPGLEEVVSRAMERDKAQRYGNVAEFALDLVEFGPAKRARASAERIVRVLETAGMPTSRDGQRVASARPAAPGTISNPALEGTMALPGGVTIAPATLAPTHAAGTMAAFGQTASPGLKKRTGMGLAFGLVGVALVGAGALLVVRLQRSEVTPEPVVPATASAVPAVPPPAAPVPTAVVEEKAPEPLAKAAVPSGSAPVAAAPPTPAAKAAPKRAATTAQPAATTQPKPASTAAPAPATTTAPKPASPFGGRL